MTELNKGLWSQLSNARGESPGLLVLRLHPQSKFNVFAALDRSTGHRFLLLKSHVADIRPPGPLPAGRGFMVRFIVTAADPEGVYSLQFELIDTAHAEVFDVIGNDILKSVIESADDKMAFNMFVARIAEWQNFLDQLPAGGLSEPAQQGLFAELWFLLEFMLKEMAPDKAVGTWAGPKALAKDFQLPGVAFEVKSTSAKQHSRFNISSEVQLDAQGVGRLILYCVLLERLVAGGTSLPDLVTAVRKGLQTLPGAAGRFSELLLQIGYLDADAGRYTTRFSIRSQHFFNVRDSFPRIVEDDLRPGVGDVHYSIVTSKCDQYVIPEMEVRNIIRTASL